MTETARDSSVEVAGVDTGIHFEEDSADGRVESRPDEEFFEVVS